MNEDKVIENFQLILQSKGYKGEIVSATHIVDILKDIKKFHDTNEIFPPLYQQYKSLFEFKPEVSFRSIKSIIIIAVPVPQFKVLFRFNSGDFPVNIPPTYLYSQKIIDETQDIMQNAFVIEGYHAAYARIPFKTLAVRSGLARYGRNNITYVPDMGSFFQLCAFYSDFPLKQDNWHDLKMMEACEKCSACRIGCPTNAISSDRFLLHAGRCLTYHNEQPGEIQFPEWILPQWHNCLVGCMHCQKVCPVNKKVKNWTELGPEFTHEETELFLNGITFDELPNDTKDKLKRCDLDDYFNVFARNFKALLKKPLNN